MARWGKKASVEENQSPAVVRELPTELPADGSIQVAYTSAGSPVYVYYDYDLNVFRNYQTDEEISLDGLFEESGTPFRFFADTQDVSTTDLGGYSNDAASVPSNEDVMSQNTEAFVGHANEVPQVDNVVSPAPQRQAVQQQSVATNATVSINSPKFEVARSKNSVNDFEGPKLGGNIRVREIIENILTGESSENFREKIFEKEQELLDIRSFQSKMFNDYSALVEVTRQKRRALTAVVNDSIITVKSIINSMINENRQYSSRIKQNAHVVSEKQYIVYNELAANFQYIAANNMALSGADYEQMKRSYVECWNLRKKIIENLRLMYEFEAVIARLQYYANLFNVTSAKILESLGATAKSIDSHIIEFVSSCNNEKMVARYVASSEGIRKFKDNSRALLNEIDSTLIGIDKRRLFDGINEASHKQKIPSELKSSMRSEFPTMRVDTIGFLNNDENENTNSNNNNSNSGNNNNFKVNKTRFLGRTKPRMNKRFNSSSNNVSENSTNFVTLSPSSTVRIDDGRRF